MQKIFLKRTILKPFVPDWVVKWAVPEFEDIGPEHLNHGDMESYFPQDAPRKGEGFFQQLQVSGLTRCCLGFEDGRSLITKGVLPICFPGKHLCLWRSTAFDISGNLFMPWVQNISGQIPIIRWWWLEYDLYPSHHTILFDPKSTLGRASK